MNQNILEQLFKIYNTLLIVSTKGEDTIIMGQCLSAFNQVLAELQKPMNTLAESDTES